MVEGSNQEIYEKIRILFESSVKRNLANCILLSGGLDTSIVAAVASRHVQLTGVTVSLHDAPDLPFSRLIAERFEMNHVVVRVNERDVEQAIFDVIRVMKSFDPMEVRNDASVLIGLRTAKSLGFNRVMTGDAADELFAGYSFFFNMATVDLERSLGNMWRIMRFASKPLAESLNMEARLPFLDDEDFKSFAMQIPVRIKICRDRDQTYGKWVLRKAFEGILPDEIVWRVKTPIEQGSGTSTMPDYFDKKISDSGFDAEREQTLQADNVLIRDKEHLFYFRVYRDIYGTPRGQGEGLRPCPGCGALHSNMDYCRVCGAYPV